MRQIQIKREEKLKEDRLAHYAELRSIVSEGKMEKLHEIKVRQLILEDLAVKIEEQKKVVEEAKQKVEEELQNLIKVVKDKKIIEKDKEKTREAWRKLMDKEEGKFLDEVSSVGFERKTRAREEEEKQKLSLKERIDQNLPEGEL